MNLFDSLNKDILNTFEMKFDDFLKLDYFKQEMFIEKYWLIQKKKAGENREKNKVLKLLRKKV